ncbi:tyrosine-type recombinase/integrase [Paenibacillus sp. HJL G12]|uniref:Tyrosine-type recombinase/integrase n=1 Tax=Paenibacillus dendrobii TaxID=2691084 RepID=A0A7X3IK26_9BACL|nr:tyrosine-type recombinase/integrase [Paenibacillus dendrobii]MWV44953.1 tyrosine-type recombinase/integrase [Paenibacillus dendrobii]
MNAAKNNIVGLHTGTVYEDIRTFVSKFESKNTQSNYERSIRSFFMWFAQKSIEMLQKDDLHVRNADVVKYQVYLRNHEADYTNTTINNMMAAIQSLYEFLEINEYEVNSKYLKVDVLPDDSESAGSLFFNEAELMANLVKKQTKGQEKSSLIRLAYTTSFRKSSLLKLGWTDIKKNPEADHYLVTTIGKGGKKHTVPISSELYSELLLIKEQKYYEKYSDNKIFHLSKTTIQSMMDSLKNEMGISEERNIVFHSFRNVAASYGSLEEVKEHLNHSDINTTNKYYRHKLKDYSQSISLRMDDRLDDDVFELLSKEELIQLIKQQSVGTIIQMKKEALEMISQKEMIG